MRLNLLVFLILFQESEFRALGITSPPNGKSDYLPVLRSGSCAEKGPKQYMEDEHICIDNLVEQLGGLADFPSPGAFYGVCYLLLVLQIL